MKKRWSWRSTGVVGLYTLWCGHAEVGTVSFLPGFVRHESSAMDGFVNILDEQPAHARWTSEGEQ